MLVDSVVKVLQIRYMETKAPQYAGALSVNVFIYYISMLPRQNTEAKYPSFKSRRPLTFSLLRTSASR